MTLVVSWPTLLSPENLQYFPPFELCRAALKVKMKVAQSCLTLCDPVDYTVHGILQARILERVAIPFSRGSSNLNIIPVGNVIVLLCKY